MKTKKFKFPGRPKHTTTKQQIWDLFVSELKAGNNTLMVQEIVDVIAHKWMKGEEPTSEERTRIQNDITATLTVNPHIFWRKEAGAWSLTAVEKENVKSGADKPSSRKDSGSTEQVKVKLILKKIKDLKERIAELSSDDRVEEFKEGLEETLAELVEDVLELL